MASNSHHFSAEELTGQVSYLRALARGLVQDEGLAEDLVQEAFVKAVQRPLANPSSLSAWLRTVVRNLAVNRWREGVRRERRERVAARDEALASTSEILENHEVLDRVTAALHTLPEQYQEAVHHRYFQDLTPTQIASRLGIPLATVKGRLRRGLAQLRERLDGEYQGDRRSWVLALLPLIETPLLPLPVPEASNPGTLLPAAAKITIGGILMKKMSLVFVGLVCLGLVAGGLFWLDDEAIPIQEKEPVPNLMAARGESPGATTPAPGSSAERQALPDESGVIRPNLPGGFPVQVVDEKGDPVGAGVQLYCYHPDEAADPVKVVQQVVARPEQLLPLMRIHGVRYETDDKGMARVRRPTEGLVYMIAMQGGRIGSGTMLHSTVEPFRLELARTTQFAVKVIDQEGVPQSGVQVQASFVDVWSGNPPLVAVTERQSGVARFPHLRLGRYEPFGHSEVKQARICVACPLSQPVSAIVDLDNLPAEPLVLKLPPTGSVQVELTEQDGSMARGEIKVALVPEKHLLKLKRLLPVLLSSRMAVGGKVLFPRVTTGGNYAALAVRMEGASIFRLNLSMVSMGRGAGPEAVGGSSLIKVGMRPAGSRFTGRVVTAKGIPIANVTLHWDLEPRVKGSDHHKVSQAYRVVLTDGEGQFGLDLPWPLERNQKQVLRLDTRFGENYSGPPLVSRVALKAGVRVQELGELVMTRNSSLVTGLVVDQLQRPVAGAKVQLYIKEKRKSGRAYWVRQDQFTEQTDNQGRFSLSGSLPMPEIKVKASRAGYLDGKGVETTTGQNCLILSLEKGERVEGSLLIPPDIDPDLIEILMYSTNQQEDQGKKQKWVRGKQAFPQADGSFFWPLVKPGLKKVTISIQGGGKPLVQIDFINIAVGRNNQDPRLQKVDLRNRIFPVKVTMVLPPAAAAKGRLSFKYAYGPLFDDAQFHYGDNPVLLARQMPVDILIIPNGYRGQLFTGVTGSIRVQPKALLPVGFSLPADLPAIGPDCQIKVQVDLVKTPGLEKVEPSFQTSLRGGRITTYNQDGRAELSLKMPGTYRLTWVVLYQEKFVFLDGARILKHKPLVRVVDGSIRQEINLFPTRVELTRALAYARACGRVSNELRSRIKKPSYKDIPPARKLIEEATRGLR